MHFHTFVTLACPMMSSIQYLLLQKTTLPPATLSMLEFSHFLTLMMNYDKTNGNKSGYYGFLHFCHIDMPYSSVNAAYLIAIVATYYPAPSTPKAYMNFQKKNIWMMNYEETNGNQSGFYDFLDFCHIETPYDLLMSSIVQRESAETREITT